MMYRFRSIFYLLTILICFGVFLLLTFKPVTVFYSIPDDTYKIADDPQQETVEPKIILMWTTFFSQPDYLPKPGPDVGCTIQDCILTSDRKLFNRSGMVIFHWIDTSLSDLPRYRVPGQKWILFVLESPHHTDDLSVYNGIMNLTATYRLDSDIYTPYKSYRKLNSSELQALRQRPKVDYSVGKKHMVAWFVSNCHTASKREDYVKELSKHIEVHIFGACGDHQCTPKMSPECYNNVSQEYRFYLSFENSNCKDYVTEKYYHILLMSSMLPVVLGGANYSQVGPPNAFIDVAEFPQPAKLAAFLKELANDSVRYNKYFEWKEHYTLPGRDWICNVCELLHGPQVESVAKSDLSKWWSKEAQCKKWEDGKFVPIN